MRNLGLVQYMPYSHSNQQVYVCFKKFDDTYVYEDHQGPRGAVMIGKDKVFKEKVKRKILQQSRKTI